MPFDNWRLAISPFAVSKLPFRTDVGSTPAFIRIAATGRAYLLMVDASDACVLSVRYPVPNDLAPLRGVAGYSSQSSAVYGQRFSVYRSVWYPEFLLRKRQWPPNFITPAPMALGRTIFTGIELFEKPTGVEHEPLVKSKPIRSSPGRWLREFRTHAVFAANRTFVVPHPSDCVSSEN